MSAKSKDSGPNIAEGLAIEIAVLTRGPANWGWEVESVVVSPTGRAQRCRYGCGRCRRGRRVRPVQDRVRNRLGKRHPPAGSLGHPQRVRRASRFALTSRRQRRGRRKGESDGDTSGDESEEQDDKAKDSHEWLAIFRLAFTCGAAHRTNSSEESSD